jgi:hypothetical protein
MSGNQIRRSKRRYLSSLLQVYFCTMIRHIMAPGFKCEYFDENGVECGYFTQDEDEANEHEWSHREKD